MSLSRMLNDSFFRKPSIFSNEFHNMFNDLERATAALPGNALSSAGSFAPRVRLIEEGPAYHLEAEVPGFNKESLSIDFPDTQVLRLCGQYTATVCDEPPKMESQTQSTAASFAEDTSKQLSDKRAKVWHNERISRSFQRFVSLPSPVNADAVKASLKDGVLSVVLPKLERTTESKKIEIAEA